MHPRSFLRSSNAFTLIELLVVIAIIAILSVVVILTLNPAELLRQSRDSNRVSDMTTLNSALGVYSEDQSSASNFNMGSSSVVYVSIPDSTATSTAGDQCQGLSLPSLSTTYAYHCAASSTFRNTNGTGWIPVNFSSISSGSPIGNLPIDPTNNSSTRLYYTYTTNGTNYEVTSAMESQKYGVGGSNDVISNDGGTLASVYEKGSKLGLEPMDYGDSSLVGYWNLNEGTSSTAYDYSGNNATGSWVGTQIGTNGYYTTNAKVGPYAGDFDGSTDAVSIPHISSVSAATGTYSVSLWYECSSVSAKGTLFSMASGSNDRTAIVQSTACSSAGGGYLVVGLYNGSFSTVSSNTMTLGWNFIALVVNKGVASAYLNNSPISGGGSAGSTFSADTNGIGYNDAAFGGYFSGLIDDVRIYNRALSAAQISAMYTGGK